MESELQAVKERMLESIHQDARKDCNGYRFEPLLSIELDHVIPDELHLLLRITDVLLRNLINSAIGYDNNTIRGRGNDDVLKGPMITMLQRAINDCGVRFSLTKKEGKLEWTSLAGTEKLKVLKKLPEVLLQCQPPDTSDLVKKLWEVQME